MIILDLPDFLTTAVVQVTFKVMKSWTSDLVMRAVGWKGLGGTVGHVQMTASHLAVQYC